MANLRPLFSLALAMTLGLGATRSLAHDPAALAGVEESTGEATWALDASDPGPIWADDADPRALSEFNEALAPHGEWYQHPQFGLLWVPSRASVGGEFVPYLSHGRWALDSHGNWVWQSDYPFGWAVFHYGRWVEVPGIGWGWIPGYTYSPAWVVWGSPGDNIAYVGWAPLGPSFVWVDGVAVAIVPVESPYWVFCRSHYAFSPHLTLHVVKDERRHEYLERRTVERHPSYRAPDPAYRGVAFYGPNSAPRSGASGVAPREVTGDGVGPRSGAQGPPVRSSTVRAPSAHELKPGVEVRIVSPSPGALPRRAATRAPRQAPAHRQPPPERLDAQQTLEVAPEHAETPRPRAEPARAHSPRGPSPTPRRASRRGKLPKTPAQLRPERSSAPRAKPSH